VVPVTNDPADFVNVDWRTENWEYDEIYKVWQKKLHEKYRGDVKADLDGDDEPETIKRYHYDLELSHLVTEANIQVDVTVLPQSKQRTRMDVFLANFIDNISGGRSWYEKYRYTGKTKVSRTYASKLIVSREFKIGENDAVLATIELADLNQLELDPDHRSGVITILLVRLNDYVFRPRTAYLFQKQAFPAILTVMLYSRPEHHAELKPDFYALTKAIRLNGKSLDVPALEITADTPETTPVNPPSALP
jgi:hypothetical protein